METRCDTVSGELHATFTDNSPSRSHALPLIAPPVALPLAQPVARRWPGMVDTVAANNLPKPTMTDQGATHVPTMKQPTSMLIFPHQHTNKSPHNQHVSPILHVGSHHLQYQLSRTIKPKSHHTTNTSGPLTQARTICTAAASPTNCTYSKGPTLWPTPSSIPSTQCKSPDAVPFSDRLSQRILLLNDFHCRGSSCGKH